MFLKAPGFDLEIDTLGEGPAPEWLTRCYDPRHLDFIHRCITLEGHLFSVETRFEMAMQLGVNQTTSGFLKCLDMQASDPRLASLRTRHSGRSVLHQVARHFSELANYDFPEHAMNEWVSLGVAVLKNGANPSSVAREQIESGRVVGGRMLRRPEWHLTPLLDCLGVSNWGFDGDNVSSLRRILRGIHIWVDMVQQAGIDLIKYGAGETEVWGSLTTEMPSTFFFEWSVSGLVYGSTPEQWSIKIRSRHTEGVQIYGLKRLPGHFPDANNLPTKIFWGPTPEEQMEGLWVAQRPLTIRCRSIDLQQAISTLEKQQAMARSFTAIQDDNGPISRMNDCAKRGRALRVRSHSQPPPSCLLSDADFDCVWDGFFYRYESIPWCPPYHRCPFDSKWGFQCGQSRSELYVFDPRGCMKGMAQGPSSIQESPEWFLNSFLGEISICQDNMLPGSTYQGIRHTGTADCPWKCRAVNLDKLNVPDALWPYHPQKFSARYEKYRAKRDTPGSSADS